MKEIAAAAAVAGVAIAVPLLANCLNGYRSGQSSLSVEDASALADWPWEREWKERSVLQTPYGRTAVVEARPDDYDPAVHPTVVLVHGISVSSHVWRQAGVGLVQRGFRVIAYDLPGRGAADAPAGVPQTVSLFVSHLAMVVDLVGLDRFHLCGYSLGGGIATTYARYFGERHLLSLTLIAPAGYPQDMPPTTHLTKIPVLSEALFSGIGRFTLTNFVHNAYQQPSAPHVSELVKRASHNVGVLWDRNPSYRRALLSTIQNFEFHSLDIHYKQVATHEYPVAVLWGKDDKTVPYANHEKLLRDIPRAILYPLDLAHAIDEGIDQVVEALGKALG